MNLRPHPVEPAELNLTPLIDVVFLLLIFFMLSTSFERPLELDLQLPTSDQSEPAASQSELLRISIDRDSQFYLDDAPIASADRSGLADAIAAALVGRINDSVLIEADAQTPHQAVMWVLDALRFLGIEQVAFAAIQDTAPP